MDWAVLKDPVIIQYKGKRKKKARRISRNKLSKL